MDNSFKFLKGAKMIHPTTGITLEYLDKAHAVCFVLFNETKEKVILVKQFRPGPKDYSIEACAGLIDGNEEPRVAAFRELKEETGYLEKDVTDIEEMPQGLYVSPGYTTERLYFFSARLKSDDIKPIEQSLDHGEEVEVVWVDVKNITKMSTDMKTILVVTCFQDKK